MKLNLFKEKLSSRMICSVLRLILFTAYRTNRLMDAIGQEVPLPVVMPVALWQESGGYGVIVLFHLNRVSFFSYHFTSIFPGLFDVRFGRDVETAPCRLRGHEKNEIRPWLVKE